MSEETVNNIITFRYEEGHEEGHCIYETVSKNEFLFRYIVGHIDTGLNISLDGPDRDFRSSFISILFSADFFLLIKPCVVIVRLLCQDVKNTSKIYISISSIIAIKSSNFPHVYITLDIYISIYVYGKLQFQIHLKLF